jgi:hypothetical protein
MPGPGGPVASESIDQFADRGAPLATAGLSLFLGIGLRIGAKTDIY